MGEGERRKTTSLGALVAGSSGTLRYTPLDVLRRYLQVEESEEKERSKEEGRKVSLGRRRRERERKRTNLDAASLAVNAVLTVDNQPLPHRVLLASLSVHILVNRRGTDPPEQSSVFLDVRLDVRRTGGLLKVKVDRLILGVVGVGA